MNKLINVSRLFTAALLVGTVILSACSEQKPTSVSPGPKSDKTGLEFSTSSDEKGYEVKDYKGQPPAPGMVYIEGGRTVLGSSEEDVAKARDNIERTVSIQSFFMDEGEVANINWLEYLYYLKTDSGDSYMVYEKALPDTTVWMDQLQYNDPYIEHYFRYPGFRFYPVVGVSWLQAQDYCKWRTAVVNEKLAEEAGVLETMNIAEGQRIPLESGVVVPDYRLPTEAEWEYAALALIGTSYGQENQTLKRIYPWDGHSLRNPYDANMGDFLANFKRGRGDYAGIAGKLNDGSLITDQVYAYPPNDYGLYNMAGNVNEWVEDIYRPLNFQDMEDLNPVRTDKNKRDPDFLDASAGYDQTTSLINNQSRVYKGGAWDDVAFWMSPGQRRYWPEDSASASIGFRCAMIQAGRNY